MASVKILLYTSKLLTNGDNPIMLRIIKDQKSKYFSMGYSCHIDLWDSKKDLPKKKHPSFEELKINLKKKLEFAEDILLKLENQKGSDFSLEDFKQKFYADSKRITVLVYLNETIDNLMKEERIKYAASYKDLRRILLKFRNGKDFNFPEINQPFLLSLEQYFKQNGLKLNTMGIYMRNLRALYGKAIKDGYAKKENYPFEDYKVSKLKNNTKKRAISKVEIKQIEALMFEQGSHLYDSKNFFMFSYYCSGMNFKDVAKLDWSNFEEEGDKVILSYLRGKTKRNPNKEIIKVALVSPAIMILEYYKSYRSDNYVFPFLDKVRHKTAVSIENRIEATIGVVNEDLKEIAKLAGIETDLTTYVARHTFATVMKKSGVSTSIISEMMGHESEKITQTYLDSFENEQIYNASLNLL